VTAERFQKMRELFDAVLEQEPERREQLLQTASSIDQELVEHVRLMLVAREKSPDFLDQPAAKLAGESMLTSTSSRVFEPGTIVASRFEIVDLLGRGGMGEVYHARDQKLDRSVALKVIAAGHSDTGRSKKRFLQEARAASALNHPNIVAIYDIAEENGVEYIAMEYVPGKSLDDVIAGRRLPLEAALRYASQIADALGAAHGAGVVHRDVKPGNILIAANGTAKILDFGLAKLNGVPVSFEIGVTDSDFSFSQGAIVGTVAYMSPEQAEGKTVDARSDIFSFGCVLYEMLTGRRPFEGESKISTLTAILHREPRAIREFAPELPPEVEQTVRQCLAKDPAGRPSSMSDVKMLIAAVVSPSSASNHSLKNRAALVSRRWIWFLILLCISAVSFAFFWITTRSKSVLTIEKVSPFTSTGTSRKTAMSPDGRYVAYVLGGPGRQSLRIRQTNAATDIEIVPTADVAYLGLTFVPDGNHLFYGVIENTTSESILYRIPTLGGLSQAVTRKLDSPITFSPSGSEYAFVRENASDGRSLLIVVETSGERERIIASRALPEYFDYPTWSPAGDRIAVSIVGVNDTARLATVHPDGSNRIQDMASHWRRISGIGWLKKGFLVSGRAPGEGLLHLWQVGPDGARHRLTPDLSDYWGVGISKDLRTVVSVQERSFSNLWRVPITSATKAQQLVEGVTRYSRFALIPDGRLIYEEQASDVRRLVMSDHRGIAKPLTTSGKSNIGTVCPDNRTVLYTWHISPPPTLWKMNTDGSGAVAVGPETTSTDIACSGDSRWAIYTAPGSGKYSTLWKASLLDGRTVQLTTKPSEHPALSPDGRRIAFFYVDEKADTHQRAPDLALISSEGGRIQRTLPLPATVHKAAGIKWTPDGRSVTYVTFRQGTAEIWGHPVSGGTPNVILRFPRELIHSFQWAPDGHDLYVSRGPSVYDVVLMSIR